jgi:hypothetical protein
MQRIDAPPRPSIAQAERGAVTTWFRLDDGRHLCIARDDVGAEEGFTVTLFAPDGRRICSVGRRLYLAAGFMEHLRVLGPRRIGFDFPGGTPWILSVHDAPCWLTPLGLGPLRLRQQRRRASRDDR